MNPLDPDAPFEWVRSENGNQTCEWSFLNATIFQQDDGWKYVLNVDGGSRETATFSKRYRSEDQAIVMAEQKMEDILSEVLARRS